MVPRVDWSSSSCCSMGGQSSYRGVTAGREEEPKERRQGYSDVFDSGCDGSKRVTFLDGIGKVASQTAGTDEGSVVTRCADQSRGRNRSSLADQQTIQQNCQLSTHR